MLDGEHAAHRDAARRERVDVRRIGEIANDRTHGAVFLDHDHDVIMAVGLLAREGMP